jgi:hypothetical protein
MNPLALLQVLLAGKHIGIPKFPLEFTAIKCMYTWVIQIEEPFIIHCPYQLGEVKVTKTTYKTMHERTPGGQGGISSWFSSYISVRNHILLS